MERNLPKGEEALKLFSLYMRTCGVPEITQPHSNIPGLDGKKLAIVNAGTWITFWSYYFGGLLLPGVQLINVANEAVQLSFMAAHHRGDPVPPQVNIDAFGRYAADVVDLYGADAVLLTCSTMNRSAHHVREKLKAYGTPVIQIDEAMMEEAVDIGGKSLVIATHGPTVKNTQLLLQETADRLGKAISFTGSTIEEAFDHLGAGRIEEHNKLIAEDIRRVSASERITNVVLAQLSMTIFLLSYPDPEKEFGIPVITSGMAGFKRIKKLWAENGAVS